MTIGHLEERTFANWALDPTDENAVAHLNECDTCRKEAVEFRSDLATFREALVTASERQLPSWTAPVADEMPGIRFPGIVHRWAPRVALAALLLTAAMVLHRPRPAVVTSANDVSDQVLLLSINDDLNRTAPEALAPAEVFLSQTNDFTGGSQGPQ